MKRTSNKVLEKKLLLDISNQVLEEKLLLELSDDQTEHPTEAERVRNENNNLITNYYLTKMEDNISVSRNCNNFEYSSGCIWDNSDIWKKCNSSRDNSDIWKGRCGGYNRWIKKRRKKKINK